MIRYIMAQVEVPSASDVAERWNQGATGAGGRFVENATSASQKWLNNAGSDQAQSNFEQAMSDPEVLQRRQDNSDSAAQSRFESSLQAFGQQRFQSGINNSGQRFQSAISEVLGAIEGLQIPDRGRAMSQANMDRATQVQRALNEAGEGV
jgi:hypothetical protein